MKQIALAVLGLFLYGLAPAVAQGTAFPDQAGPPSVILGSPVPAGGGGERPLETGLASWYGDPFHGRLTASGEVFDKAAMTAAHKSLPFGTLVLVRRLDGGAEVTVRINDRGPFVSGRIIDLSEAAGRVLGLDRTGTARVAIYVLKEPQSAMKRVQLGAFSVEANARAVGDRAAALGFPVRYERVRAVTRVLVIVAGADLEAVLARLRAAGFSSFVVSDD